MVTTRDFFGNSTEEELDDLDDETRAAVDKANIMPDVSELAKRIFFFVRRNTQHCLRVGMSGVYGVDKYKLEQLALNRGILLYKYDYFVESYIDSTIKKFSKKD